VWVSLSSLWACLSLASQSIVSVPEVQDSLNRKQRIHPNYRPLLISSMTFAMAGKEYLSSQAIETDPSLSLQFVYQ